MSVFRALFGKKVERGQVWEFTYFASKFKDPHTAEVLEVKDGHLLYKRSDSKTVHEELVKVFRYAYKYSHEMPIL